MSLPQDLTPLVRDWLHEPDGLPPPRVAEVSQRVRQTPQQRGVLPRLDLGRFHMFSALKFVAAAAIVALFGGLLLAGILDTSREDAPVPAVTTESPPATFPTGSFVSEQTGRALLEFLGSGTALYRSSTAPAKNGSWYYAVDGDIYTDLGDNTPGSARYNQPTYRWHLEDERLSFELVGEDTDETRRSFYEENTFRLIDDPTIALVAMYDYEAGQRVHGMPVFLSEAESVPDAFTDRLDIRGHVATGPIAQGQPITPDLVVLAE